ncbi:uncharacterized protein LOC128883875 [Hylaeus volcanicus]|uniref:uncharacterized protein LOC128883875 n=1 Tax=Hylaeus volcanicus TaxID=313075 RepID=UPI0023B8228E|nr:uncharacterized protein LOC128883875 [Hylaeus volcanicus]
MSSNNAECADTSSFNFLQRSTKRVLDAAASATRFSFSSFFSKPNQQKHNNSSQHLTQDDLLDKSLDTQAFSDDLSVQDFPLPLPGEWEKTPRFFYKESSSVNEIDTEAIKKTNGQDKKSILVDLVESPFSCETPVCAKDGHEDVTSLRLTNTNTCFNGNGTEPRVEQVIQTQKTDSSNLIESVVLLVYQKNAVLLGHRLEWKDELALLEELICVLRKPCFNPEPCENNLWQETFNKPSLLPSFNLSTTNNPGHEKTNIHGRDSPSSVRDEDASKEIENTLILHTCSDDEPSSEHSDTLSHIYDEDTEAVQCEGEKWEGLSTRDTSPSTPRSRLIISSVTPQRRFPQFTKQRKALCSKWFQRFNETVFENQIPSSTIIQWNSRLTRTAGQTMMTRNQMVRTVQIQLSSRVIDKEERLQSTLLHEMCHAAQFLLENEEQPAHGPGFQKWAKKARRLWPFIPVTITHNYEIHYPKRYQCEACGHIYGRHSKISNLSTARCGKQECQGSLIFLGHFLREGKILDPSSHKRELTPYTRFIKDNYHKVKSEKANYNSKQVMSDLVAEWRASKNVVKNSQDTPNKSLEALNDHLHCLSLK